MGASNQHGVIVTSLARLVTGLALAGVVVYDAGAVVVNYVTLDSFAATVAVDLYSKVSGGTEPDSPLLVARARDLARARDARLVAVGPSPQGGLEVTLARRARTLVARRIEALGELTRATATARAGTG